jgi:hypothetical protein
VVSSTTPRGAEATVGGPSFCLLVRQCKVSFVISPTLESNPHHQTPQAPLLPLPSSPPQLLPAAGESDDFSLIPSLEHAHVSRHKGGHAPGNNGHKGHKGHKGQGTRGTRDTQEAQGTQGAQGQWGRISCKDRYRILNIYTAQGLLIGLA